MKKISLEQLEEMQKDLFKKQCDLDIQKAFVKHFIKKKQSERLKIPETTKEHKLYELSKELVYQMTGKYTEDVQNADFQIAWHYLSKAMDFIRCCEIDFEDE